MTPRTILAFAIVALAFCSGRATAASRRIALVTAHNQGLPDEVPLEYAEKDADRIADALLHLGGFDVVERKTSMDAAALAAEIARMKDRVQVWRDAGERVFFLFYYSGHADQRGLHLGSTIFSNDELVEHLSGLGAELRVAIIDACDSGALVRGKGVAVKAPIEIELTDELEATGQAIIASTSHGESAQESELLQGSFFTTHLVAGLRGAADQNGDGAVGLREVYAYAYDRTVKSTVVSVTGIQHPSYSINLTGKRDVALAWPGKSEASLVLRATTPGTFLVTTGADGSVVAEVPAPVPGERRLGLREGRYVIKKRSADGLRVAEVSLARDTPGLVDEPAMKHTPYLMLAEKGRLATLPRTEERGMVGWLALGGAIAALGTGAVLEGMAIADYNRRDALLMSSRTVPEAAVSFDEVRELGTSGDRKTVIGAGLLGAAAVLGVIAAFDLLSTDGGPRAAFVAGDGGVGFVVSGAL